jgi:hypothetical protein
LSDTSSYFERNVSNATQNRLIFWRWLSRLCLLFFNQAATLRLTQKRRLLWRKKATPFRFKKEPVVSHYLIPNCSLSF